MVKVLNRLGFTSVGVVFLIGGHMFGLVIAVTKDIKSAVNFIRRLRVVVK